MKRFEKLQRAKVALIRAEWALDKAPSDVNGFEPPWSVETRESIGEALDILDGMRTEALGTAAASDEKARQRRARAQRDRGGK